MNPVSHMNKAILKFEQVTVMALQFLMVIVILVSTVVLFVLGFEALKSHLGHIGSVEDLLFVAQRSIAGILIAVLGLEVLETLKVYFLEHYVRLEVILVVAIIATSRYLVQMDFDHASPLVLFGLSAVIASLTLGYFLVKKALHADPAKTEANQGNQKTDEAVSKIQKQKGVAYENGRDHLCNSIADYRNRPWTERSGDGPYS
jgi:uncharacterized membrane protein (DUF373 family)